MKEDIVDNWLLVHICTPLMVNGQNFDVNESKAAENVQSDHSLVHGQVRRRSEKSPIMQEGVRKLVRFDKFKDTGFGSEFIEMPRVNGLARKNEELGYMD